MNGNEQWRIDQHNHDPAIDLSGHPSARRMDANDKRKVRDMASAGLTPSSILSTLKRESDNQLITRKDICNEIQRGKEEFLAERSPISALLGSFHFNVNFDTNGHIIRLFSDTMPAHAMPVLNDTSIGRMNEFVG